MKKLIAIVVLMLFGLCASSEVLKGSVSYTPESARKEAFEGVKYSIPVEAFKKHLVDSNYAENMKYKRLGSVDLGDRTVQYFSNGAYGVTYSTNLFIDYFYSSGGDLLCFHVSTTLTYPMKKYSYTKTGKLESIAFAPCPKKSFEYYVNGDFIGRWVGDSFYNPDGEVTLHRTY